MSEFITTIGDGFNYTTAGTQPSEKGVAPARRNTLRLYNRPKDPSNIGRGEITVYSFAEQGYNHPEGDFSQNANGFAWSTLETYSPGELFPAPAGVNTTSTSVSGNLVGLHSVDAFGVHFLGIGSGANAALFKEASATSPIPTAITYSPAGAICSLTQVLANGVERLAVGHVGQPVKLMSDSAGTVATTMDASTNSCWGIILSGINATTAGVPVMLMYCGTSITTKATDATLTTATVATIPPTTVNAGGFAIGAVTPAGRAQRAYWAIPTATNANGDLRFGSETHLFNIMSTSMLGDDLLPHYSFYCPTGIQGAVPFRNGMLYHNARHIVYWDGQREYDLGIFRRRVRAGQTTNIINSDERRRIRQILVDGPECGVVWQWFDVNGINAGSMYAELYNFETSTWHNTGRPFSLAATGAAVDLVLGCGPSTISPNTRYFYSYCNADTSFRYNYIGRVAESLLWQNSLGSGGTYTNDIPTYQSGSLLGCRWWLDAIFPSALKGEMSLRRVPKIITEVEFGGNLDYGGTSTWTFEVLVQGRGVDGTTTMTAYDQTFSQGQPSAHYTRKNTLNGRANIQDIQLYLTAATFGTSRTIPQLLPFTIRFAYDKDGNAIMDPLAGAL